MPALPLYPEAAAGGREGAGTPSPPFHAQGELQAPSGEPGQSLGAQPWALLAAGLAQAGFPWESARPGSPGCRTFLSSERPRLAGAGAGQGAGRLFLPGFPYLWHFTFSPPVPKGRSPPARPAARGTRQGQKWGVELRGSFQGEGFRGGPEFQIPKLETPCPLPCLVSPSPHNHPSLQSTAFSMSFH